jgi:hypothetical protein
MCKFETVAAAIVAFSWYVYFSSPLLTFLLPAHKIWYGYGVTVALNILMYMINYCNSDCGASILRQGNQVAFPNEANRQHSKIN